MPINQSTFIQPLSPSPVFADAFGRSANRDKTDDSLATGDSYPLTGSVSLARPQKSVTRHLATAAGLTGAALLLHKLPAHASTIAWFSSDWKDWVRMGLGIAAIDHINKGFEWKPPPWLLGLQTVVALNLVTNGPLNTKGWRQLPLLAVFVPALVQATHQANEWVQQKLTDQNSTVPPAIPKLLVSLISTAAGLVVLRRIVNTPVYQQFSGQAASQTEGSSQVLGAEAIVCSRCGGTHLVCMSEISDMFGSMLGWIKGESRGVKSENDPVAYSGNNRKNTLFSSTSSAQNGTIKTGLTA